MIGGTDLGLGVLISMKDAFSANAHKVEASMKSLDATLAGGADRMTSSIERIQKGTMMMGAGAALLALPVALVAATAATQKALGEVSSVGVKDLRALEDAAESFTNQWAGTNKAEFIGAAYDVKSALANLSDEAVGQFSAMAALTGKASKATTQEMVGTFTTAYGIFKPIMSEFSDIEWATAFSGALAQTVGVFKTTGPAMAEAIKNVGATAAASNIPLQEQMAILGQLQTTMPGSEAGTLYKAFVMKAAEAGQELGLSFVDNMGRLKGVLPILQEIKTRFPDLSQASAQVHIKKAFGSDEAVKFVLQMSQGMKELEGNISSIGDAMKGGTALTEEMAKAMNQDIGSQFTLVRQQLMNLAEILGRSLLPIVLPVMHGLSAVILWFQKLAKAAPNVTRAVLVLSMALGALLVGAGALVAGFGTLGLLLPAITAGVTGFGAAVASVGGLIAAWFWPVTLVIGAVALAIYGLKRAWETNFAGIRDVVVGTWEKVKAVFEGIRELVSSLSGGKGQMTAALAKQLQDAGLMGFVVGVFRAYYRVREFLGGIADAFSGTFARVREILEPAATALREAFAGFSPAIQSLFQALGLANSAADASAFRTFGMVLGSVASALVQVGAYAIRFVVTPLTWIIRILAAVVRSAVSFGETVMAVFAAAAGFVFRFALPIRLVVEAFRMAGRVIGAVWDVATGNVSLVDGLRAIGHAVGTFLVTPFTWARDVALGAFGMVRGLVSSISDGFRSSGSAIAAVFQDLGVVRAVQSIVDALRGLFAGDLGFTDAGHRILEALARGAASAAMLPLEVVAKIVAAIFRFFGVDLGAVGASWIASLTTGMRRLVSEPGQVLREALRALLGGAKETADQLLAFSEGLLAGMLEPFGIGLDSIRGFFRQLGAIVSSGVERLATIAIGIAEPLVRPFVSIGERVGQVRDEIVQALSGFGALASMLTTPFRDAIDGLSAGIGDAGSSMWGSIVAGATEAWTAVSGLFGGAWSFLSNGFAAAGASIQTALTELASGAFDAGRNILLAIADGVRAAVTAPYEAIKGALARARDLLPFSDAKEGPLANLAASGRALLDTFSGGIARAAAAPAAAVENAFGRIDTLGRKLAAPAVIAGTLALTPAIAGGLPKDISTSLVAPSIPAIPQPRLELPRPSLPTITPPTLQVQPPAIPPVSPRALELPTVSLPPIAPPKLQVPVPQISAMTPMSLGVPTRPNSAGAALKLEVPTPPVSDMIPPKFELPVLPAPPKIEFPTPKFPQLFSDLRAPGPEKPSEGMPAISVPPVLPPEPSRLLVETRGALAPPEPRPSGSPDGDVAQILEAILRKLDSLADRPISLSVSTKIDGREIARAVWQDLREQKTKNYETL